MRFGILIILFLKESKWERMTKKKASKCGSPLYINILEIGFIFVVPSGCTFFCV